MATKETNMKEVLADAKQEIFEGKSEIVKQNFQNLLGKNDGIKARLAMVTKKIEKELADNESEIARFSAMTVDEAFNDITYTKSAMLVDSRSYGVIDCSGITLR